MEEKKDFFKDYVKEKKSFSERIKEPKFWTVLVVAAAGIFLAIQYIVSSSQSLSVEELKASFEIVSIDSIWVNKEVTPYGVTIVPSITLRVKNIGEKSLRHVKFVGIFSFAENGEQMSDGFTPVFRTPLQPGETSEEILVRAFNGYKAKSKASFVNNKTVWKKINVKIFARTNAGFAELGVFPVKQEIEGLDMTALPSTGPGDAETRHVDDVLQKSVLVVWNQANWIYKQASMREIIIVPSVTIKVKNVGTSPIHHVSFSGKFEITSSDKLFSQGVTMALKDPLSPQMTSEEIQIQAEYGYTVSSMDELEKNKSEM